MKTRSLLFSLGLLATILVGAYYYLTNGRIISTDNAYLKFDKVTLSAEVAGAVTSVAVKENQQVQAGDLLVTLYDANYQVAREKARAQLKNAESRIKSLKASYQTKQAQLDLAVTDLEFAAKEYQRELNLSNKNLTSEARIDDRKYALDTAREHAAIVEKELAQLQANLNDRVDAPINEYAEVKTAQADLNLANINLQHTQITAPFSGFVSHLPQLGQRINLGRPVLSLVSNSNVWIEANFKETEVANLRADQPVEITIDAYPQLNWQGSIESLSPATGAEYSVLPPQNATGNWIKVVQRIPIRIRMQTNKEGPMLRAGMSATIRIDTHSSPIQGTSD